MNEVVVKVIGNYSYQTSRCLGQGVYGKVYEGVQRQSKQKVAIKKIDLVTFTNDRYLQKAILSQIYLLKKFNHPNIVKFKDVLSSKNSLYIITQFCKNGDLKQLIKRKRFKQQQAFQIITQLLSGFQQLIKQKIIHRDLKPANILINDGIYKIGDFGFAKYVDNYGSQMLKSFVGSPIYMVPQILQKTQYTTKCDIWSLGIIFYQMIHGYPPWKASSEQQLLRTLKNVPITQVLKKSNLSSKGNQFLKRTLAFSQQQRIGWIQLFQTFGHNITPQKLTQDLQSKPSINFNHKQKLKTTSGFTPNYNPLNQNITSQWDNDNKGNNGKSPLNMPQTSFNHSNPTQNYNSPLTTIGGLQSPYNNNTNNNILPPERPKQNYYSSNPNSYLRKQETYPSETHYASAGKKNAQIQNAIQWRQYLIYYHFYCIQMLTHYAYIQQITNKPQLYGKMLYSLATLVKNRSTYCLKINKNVGIQDIYNKMQLQHESYEMFYNGIVNLLQRNNHYKTIRNQYSLVVGNNNDVINEQKMQKMQNFMIAITTQNAQMLSEQVKKKVKNITIKDSTLVQVLDYMLDVLRLALGKSRAIKQIQQQDKQQDEDIKQYVARVFGKVDRLAANI